MCGIGGAIFYKKNRLESELNFARALIEGIIVENENRGSDASGIVTFGKTGGHNLYKLPVEASRLVETQDWVEFMKANINDNTANVLVHTRAYTKGEPSNNDNNHPIETYSCVGVHNGWLWNDDDLFAEKGMFRQAEVDSEAIFRLVDTKGLKMTKEKLKDISEELQGAFTFAFVKKMLPTQMWISRLNNPITMMFIPQLNLLTFASEKNFLVNALKFACQACFGDANLFGEDDVVFFQPQANAIYMFDVDNVATADMEQAPMFFEGSWGYSYGSSSCSTSCTPSNIASIMQNIETMLVNEEIVELHDYIDKVRGVGWSEGYAEGRASISTEIEQRENVAYSAGYQSGYKDAVRAETAKVTN